MCDYIHDNFPLATFWEADAIVQLNLKYTHVNKELQTLSALPCSGIIGRSPSCYICCLERQSDPALCFFKYIFIVHRTVTEFEVLVSFTS